MTTLLIVGVTVALPFTPLGGIFGFSALPPAYLALIAAIIVLYILSAEMAKMTFYRVVKF